MQKIKVGVFGAGRGMTMVNQLINSEYAELVAICDKFKPSLDNARRHAEEHGLHITCCESFDDFIQCDMDAVVLANYANEHAPYAVRCLESGRHVMSEVLVCANMAEAVKLVEAVEKSGKQYSYAENYCYTPTRWEMKIRYQRGDIGEFLYGEGEYVHDCTGIWPGITYGQRNHWRNTMSSSFYNTHSLGPILNICGMRPIRVSGFETPNTPPMRHLGQTAGSAALLAVTVENGGVIKSLHGLGLKPGSDHYRVNGEYGCLYDRGGNIETYIEEPDHNYEGKRENYTPEFIIKDAAGSGHGGGDFFTTYYFIKAILGDEEAKKNTIDVYRAIDMSVPGILGYRSIVNGGAPQIIPNFRNKEEREAYRNDTFCTFKEIAGDMYVPTNVFENIEIPDEVYDNVKYKWEHGIKG